MNQSNQRVTQPLNRQPANGQEEKPRRPAPTTSWFAAPFLWFNWACAWIAYGLGNLALFRVLEYAGKATVLVGVVIWLVHIPQREQADLRLTWSVLNSKGGGRRQALKYLYKKKAELLAVYGEDGYFGGIDLHKADMKWARLARSILTGANLRNTNLAWAHLEHADLRQADLTGAGLAYADLTGALLMIAYLTTADLHLANLTGANLYGTQLNCIHRQGVPDLCTNLFEANLARADLRFANLTGAALADAILNKANLRHANLTDADLAKVNLAAADLAAANLTHAYVKGVDLSQAHGLTQRQINSADGDAATKLPPGILMPDRWKKLPKTTQPTNRPVSRISK